MPIEQEPIKIVIPVEEEPALKPEQSGANVGNTLSRTSNELAVRARTVWESEQRRHTEAMARAGARHGASAAKAGLVRGLNWLSARLSHWASRMDE